MSAKSAYDRFCDDDLDGLADNDSLLAEVIKFRLVEILLGIQATSACITAAEMLMTRFGVGASKDDNVIAGMSRDELEELLGTIQ